MKRKTTIQLSLFAPEPAKEETAEEVAAPEEVDESEQAEEVEAEKTGPISSPGAANCTVSTIRLQISVVDRTHQLLRLSIT